MRGVAAPTEVVTQFLNLRNPKRVDGTKTGTAIAKAGSELSPGVVNSLGAQGAHSVSVQALKRAVRPISISVHYK